MILLDLTRAFAQLGDPRFRRVLWLGLGLTVALLFAIYACVLGLVHWITPNSVTFNGRQITALDDLLGITSILVMLFLSIFIMPPVASLFTGLFLEDVAEATEARHYPGAPVPPRTGWAAALRESAVYFAVLIVANVLAVVIYFTVPPLAPFIFWIVNGFLLGREYFTMVAMRWLGRDGAHALRRRKLLAVWSLGIATAFLLSIPLLNLLVPVVAAAAFTHLFHRVRPDRRPRPQPASYTYSE